MKKGLGVFSILCLFGLSTIAQIDFKLYSYAIDLTQSPKIQVMAKVEYEKLSDQKLLFLDLVAENGATGMKINRVYNDKNQFLNYQHHGDTLQIFLKNIAPGNGTVYLDYEGIPADGLIIGKNKHGNPTSFGDNWPNRARNWLALKDHPSEKAKLEFMVRVKKGFDCIANGELQRVMQIDDTSQVYHWKTRYELPSKVMVIGVADFSIDTLEAKTPLPISSWVYPEDEVNGFKEYAKSEDILIFFEQRIAPYPFEKLANVQSTTRYGGMENASCIFYHENSTKGDGSCEMLIAHELAHQWFGNTVTESAWAHLWLSEGFATYFTEVYRQETYGDEAYHEAMLLNARVSFDFYKKDPRPVVDSLEQDPNKLLNRNVYQKAAFLLHMIRDSIGDPAFFSAIGKYYEENKYANADSRTMIQYFEKESNRDIWSWIAPYLHVPGHPKLKLSWTQSRSKLTLEFEQTQDFDFGPIKFALRLQGEEKEKEFAIRMNTKKTSLSLKVPFDVSQISFGKRAYSLVELESIKTISQ